jgi:hypothetical protein
VRRKILGFFSQGFIILRRGVFVRAERRTGELLAGMPKHSGARGVGKKVESLSGDSTLALKDLKISKNESSTWQQLAQIPAPEFEQRLARVAGMPKNQGSVIRAAVQTMRDAKLRVQ